ncbi:hypothetical protein [Leptothermofonsia sp. ETS-13]|uniref:hypothetical protein n=1 Tax=Leptothermofonsia sp. ETS-13 TaxID=3035696 RepID=UPI003BA05118
MIISDLMYLEVISESPYIIQGGVSAQINILTGKQKSLALAKSLAFFGNARAEADAASDLFYKGIRI